MAPTVASGQQSSESAPAKCHFAVDPQLRLAPVCCAVQLAADALQKGLPKTVHARFVDLQSGCGGVPAVSEEMFAALGQRPMEIELAAAATGTDSRLHAQLVQRDQHDGAMVFFGKAAGDNPDHAGVPTATGQHQRLIIFQVAVFLNLLVGRQVNAAFEAFAAAVELVQILGQCHRSLETLRCQ